MLYGTPNSLAALLMLWPPFIAVVAASNISFFPLAALGSLFAFFLGIVHLNFPLLVPIHAVYIPTTFFNTHSVGGVRAGLSATTTAPGYTRAAGAGCLFLCRCALG